jgi:hypothetical protein
MNIISILFFIFVAQSNVSQVETVGIVKCSDPNDQNTCKISDNLQDYEKFINEDGLMHFVGA